MSNENCCQVATNESREAVFVKPKYRVRHEENAFELGVVMPGVSRENVDIALEKNVLTITGTPSAETPEGWRVVHEELNRHPFRLELQLHRDVDESSITARVESGILSLRLPLRENAKPRVIAVD